MPCGRYLFEAYITYFHENSFKVKMAIFSYRRAQVYQFQNAQEKVKIKKKTNKFIQSVICKPVSFMPDS